MKKIVLRFLLGLSLCFTLASCAWMGWGEITEIDNTPPNRPPAAPEYVAEFVGEGFLNTPLFTVERNWFMVWAATEDDFPLFSIRTSTDESYDVCGGTAVGASYFYGIGTYYIHATVIGPWAVIIDYQ